MKKLFILGLSVAMIAGASSCKKTSKGKVSNDWAVTASTSKEVSSDYKSETTETATTYKTVTTQDISGTEVTITEEGTISDFSYVISKDGTWSFTKTSKEGTYNGTAIPSPETTTVKSSGTWSFVGKNKSGEFKKNERIMFNTLEWSTTNSNGTNSGTTTDLDGSVWKITTSKKKELVLEWSSKDVSVNGGTSSTDDYTSSMTLTQK